MTDPGVDVRPLRQITGEAEFNEVFLTDVRVPDANRLGPEGGGWKVATTTLNNERVAIGSMAGGARENGIIGKVTEAWRAQPQLRNPAMHDELMRLWVEAEVAPADRSATASAAGRRPARARGRRHEGDVCPTGASGFGVRDRTAPRRRPAIRRLDDASDPRAVDFVGRDPGYRYLRAKGNSIEGGTSEILRNTIAERILGLPPEHRVDKDVALEGPGR